MLTAFTAGLSIITVSELGDKTFFMAMYLAMQNSRRVVFIAVTAALAAMTTLSVITGKVVSFLPQTFLNHAEVALFLGFGLKLLYDAYKMPAKTDCDEVLEDAKSTIDSAATKLQKASIWTVLVQAFILTFIAEWGDRTQLATISLAVNNNPLGIGMGATLGHAICTAIAVCTGRAICHKISERVLTLIGGCLFIVFGILAMFK